MLKSFGKGKIIRLRNGKLPYVKIRNWEVIKVDKGGKILLLYKPKGYTLEVKEEDIDLAEPHR